jgi:hypothetical protein
MKFSSKQIKSKNTYEYKRMCEGKREKTDFVGNLFQNKQKEKKGTNDSLPQTYFYHCN